MRTRWGWVLLVALAVGACSKKSPKVAPSAQASLLDRLPAGASIAGGLTRTAGEEELRSALAPLAGMLGAAFPSCAVDAVVKLESAVFSVQLEAKALTLIVHGAGLKSVLGPCLGAAASKLRWIDDTTGILETVPAPAGAAPLSGDAKMADLVGHVNTSSAMWLVVDEPATAELGRGLPGDVPAPRRAWVEVPPGSMELKATFEMAAADDAQKLTDAVRAMVPSLPPVVKEVKIEPSGAVVVATLPLGAFAEQAGGKATPVAAYVAVLGMAAAIAVPAFAKSGAKAKTTEAVVNVRKIYEGARAYYLENKALPPSTETTPARGTCCNGDGHRCAPDATLWAGAWKELSFSLDDPHYYVYQYTADSTSFSVAAYGDLDCDGEFSTFELVGEVGEDGSIADPKGLYRNKELE